MNLHIASTRWIFLADRVRKERENFLNGLASPWRQGRFVYGLSQRERFKSVPRINRRRKS
jgi:hypothetical protein